MKLNDKGFAITSLLYGLVILFGLIIATFLLILNVKSKRLDAITSAVRNEYESNQFISNIIIDGRLYDDPKTIMFELSNNVVKYGISSDENPPLDNEWIEKKKDEKRIIIKDISLGNYYLWAKDKDNNIVKKFVVVK